MRPLSRREKAVVGLTGGVLGLVFLSHVGFQPFLSQWQQTGNEIERLEARLKRSARLIKTKSKIKADYQHYKGLLHPQDPDQMRTQTLAEIEQATRQQALKVVEMRPLPTRRQGLFQEYVVEVTLEGTMGQLVQLIYRLQETSGLLRVERLQVSAKGSQESLLKAVMTVTRLTKE